MNRLIFTSRRTGVRRLGFTLVELLVVITIIALLVILAVPAIRTVKVAGQRTACISNLRQIGAGMLLYAGENDGRLPETTHSLGVHFEKAWIFSLAPYLGNLDEIRICPADPNREERRKANGTSYTLNSFVFVAPVDPFGQPIGQPLNHLRRMAKPAQTILAFNISDSTGTTVMSDHTHSEGWKSWKSVCADIQPDRFAAFPNADHLQGSSNFLYADGHVGSREASELKALIDRKENFARPPE